MSNQVRCPHCGNLFDIEEVLSHELEEKLREEYQQQLNKSLQLMEDEKKKLVLEQKQFEEKKKRENELFTERLQKERQRIETELQESLRISISQDFENRLKALNDQSREQDEKIKSLRTKELDLEKLQLKMEQQTKAFDFELQKRLLEEGKSVADTVRREEQQRINQKEAEFQMKMMELEKKLRDQTDLAEEMKRKIEQGSMQLQGEVQEMALESLLRNAFQFDQVKEVPKGVRGADCIQIVRNQFGQECGTIIFESKRTKEFSGEWIEKLKTDMRSLTADVAVIVTQTMPRDMPVFGIRDGVWICTFQDVGALTSVLREGIIRIYQAQKSQENKGDKMQLLYTYLTSQEFSEQWKAIREGFLAMRQSIQVERNAMERLWKAREKQLEKVMLNATHIQGSIEGIAGTDSINLDLLENGDENTFLAG